MWDLEASPNRDDDDRIIAMLVDYNLKTGVACEIAKGIVAVS
jgi:hypothetical protein